MSQQVKKCKFKKKKKLFAKGFHELNQGSGLEFRKFMRLYFSTFPYTVFQRSAQHQSPIHCMTNKTEFCIVNQLLIYNAALAGHITSFSINRANPVWGSSHSNVGVLEF